VTTNLLSSNFEALLLQRLQSGRIWYFADAAACHSTSEAYLTSRAVAPGGGDSGGRVDLQYR
jgi:hypothetical protein